MRHSKKIITICILLFYSFSFSQKRIDIKYFENNQQLPIEKASFYLVTKNDTIIPKISNEKIQLPKNMKDNFSLFVKINGKTLKIGSYRPSVFEQFEEIIVGSITDFSTLKKSWEFSDTFVINKFYNITIPEATTIANVIYSITVEEVDVSLNSDYKQYIPSFTSSYEVIKTKN